MRTEFRTQHSNVSINWPLKRHLIQLGICVLTMGPSPILSSISFCTFNEKQKPHINNNKEWKMTVLSDDHGMVWRVHNNFSQLLNFLQMIYLGKLNLTGVHSFIRSNGSVNRFLSPSQKKCRRKNWNFRLVRPFCHFLPMSIVIEMSSERWMK